MPIVRLLVIVLSGALSGVALVAAVVVLLGIGWLAAAVPTVIVLGLGAAGAALWRRLRAPGREG